ncbi:hypothetical protein [Paraflavitalea speifideaquila]|uniref:hypothetical protein n=1 Tax=Paraflavitalea speifideaquila TaxID=3076558 RepID=UPI0028E94F76|nr:hypothetical protein [Paraflavitalea speifideiaquila]
MLRTFTIDSITIVAVFDESLDSTVAASTHHYTFNQAIGHPVSAEPQTPLFNEVILRLPAPYRQARSISSSPGS